LFVLLVCVSVLYPRLVCDVIGFFLFRVQCSVVPVCVCGVVVEFLECFSVFFVLRHFCAYLEGCGFFAVAGVSCQVALFCG